MHPGIAIGPSLGDLLCWIGCGRVDVNPRKFVLDGNCSLRKLLLGFVEDFDDRLNDFWSTLFCEVL